MKSNVIINYDFSVIILGVTGFLMANLQRIHYENIKRHYVSSLTVVTKKYNLRV